MVAERRFHARVIPIEEARLRRRESPLVRKPQTTSRLRDTLGKIGRATLAVVIIGIFVTLFMATCLGMSVMLHP